MDACCQRSSPGSDTASPSHRRGRQDHVSYIPKSAAQLLNEFQDLEGLYARLAEVPEKWRKKLAAHQEMAFTCREVARLQTDLQLDGNLQQLRLTR